MSTVLPFIWAGSPQTIDYAGAHWIANPNFTGTMWRSVNLVNWEAIPVLGALSTIPAGLLVYHAGLMKIFSAVSGTTLSGYQSGDGAIWGTFSYATTQAQIYLSDYIFLIGGLYYNLPSEGSGKFSVTTDFITYTEKTPNVAGIETSSLHYVSDGLDLYCVSDFNGTTTKVYKCTDLNSWVLLTIDCGVPAGSVYSLAISDTTMVIVVNSFGGDLVNVYSSVNKINWQLLLLSDKYQSFQPTPLTMLVGNALYTVGDGLDYRSVYRVILPALPAILRRSL